MPIFIARMGEKHDNVTMFKHERALELLEEQGRKKGWLAKKLDLNGATVHRYLKGDRDPSIATASYIAKLLGVDPKELWQDSPTKKAG